MAFSNITNLYADKYASATNAAVDKLKNKITSTDYTNATDDELLSACKEFEAYFLEQVFKGMEKTVMKDESNSSDNQLVDYFKDQTVQELAKTSTEQQGLGLAQMLYEQMKRNYNL